MAVFWRFAADMLRYRARLAVALVAAFIAAACFGGGLAALPIILRAMLTANDADRVTLRELAHNWSQRLVEETQGYIEIPAAWIDGLPTDPFRGVLLVLCGIIILTVIGAVAKFMHTYYAMDVAMRAVSGIRRRAFYHIVHLPLRTVVRQGVSDQISRVIRDTNQLRNGFSVLMSKAVSESLKGLTALFVAFALAPGLSAIALVGAPFIVIAVGLLSRRIKHASKRTLVQSSSLLSSILETMQGIRVVKVHTAERHSIGRFNRVNRRLLDDELSMRYAKALASPVVETITMFGVVLIGLLATWYILNSDTDPTNVLGALLALAIAGSAVRPLTQLSSDIHESSAAAERLGDLLSQDVEVSRRDALPRLAPHARDIVFDRVTFTYAGADRPSLTDISLRIDANETVAFVGPNGSGKTTLLSMIPRLFAPDSGRVLIDGTDIAGVSLRSLRRQIGVVTQETVIFDDTIAGNIAYGADVHDPEQIAEAARKACAEEFILERPAGYETRVGEQGMSLSGGQRQRIAIARAILRNPRILILDEATSMIDADSEAAIADALARFCRNRTALVIAHRLSTVINADRIVVMDEGRIIDIGRHDELLSRCRLYQQLCRTQLVTGDPSPDRSAAQSASKTVARP